MNNDIDNYKYILIFLFFQISFLEYWWLNPGSFACWQVLLSISYTSTPLVLLFFLTA